MVRNSKPSSASTSSPERYVAIISVASVFVSRALLLIAVFFPSRFSASALQRFSVSLASEFIRSRSATSSVSPFARRATFFVACWAAWARPRTSASLLSSCVICAMAPRYPREAAGMRRTVRRALRARRLSAERRAGLDPDRARPLPRRRLVAVRPQGLHGDRAAVGRPDDLHAVPPAVRVRDEPVAVGGYDLPGRRAGIVVDPLAVEDLDLLAIE